MRPPFPNECCEMEYPSARTCAMQASAGNCFILKRTATGKEANCSQNSSGLRALLAVLQCWQSLQSLKTRRPDTRSYVPLRRHIADEYAQENPAFRITAMFTRFRLSKVSLPFTKLSRHRRQKDRTQLRFERLEDRRLLAATDLGAIEGRVFVDLNASGDFNNGEQVDGAAVQLFLDNGTTPGVFDVGDTEQTLLGSPDTTDTNGLYRFDGLSSGNYFVVQPLQMVGSRTLNLEVRGPIAVSGVGVAGTTTIDTFATNQSLIEDLVVDSNSVSAFHDVGAEVIGTERDVEVNLQTAGAADARVLSNELLFGLSGNATADFTVVYDGNDGATAVNTSGLSTDLTDGATNTHFTITIDAQVAGDSATLTVQNATLTATETFMLNAGTSTYCLAFDAFSGDTSVFQNVGAITLAIDGNQINNDYDISNFATLQPDVETQDFLNNGVADLRLTKTVDNSSPILGQNVTFTITLTNDGIDGATNVLVRDQLPAGLTYVSDNPSQGTYDDMMGVWNVGNLSDTGVATARAASRILLRSALPIRTTRIPRPTTTKVVKTIKTKPR